jgi:hypothetical protein
MSTSIKCIISFVVGAAVGSVVTWKILDKKYNERLEEEIADIKEVYSVKKVSEPADPTENIDISDENLSAYEAHLTDIGYMDDLNKGFADKKELCIDKPYVIPPEDYGDLDDYERISLTYYADHILTDEDDEIVEDVEGLVGFESLGHFGEYEDDSVYVRNDRLKCDYEILADLRNYSEVIKRRPRQSED